MGKQFTGLWATGTVTLTATNPYEYSVNIAPDNRTAGGQGQIQLVSPFISYVYSLLEFPAPQDGTGTVTGLGVVAGQTNVMTLNFLPEPGQFALLAAGGLALGVLFVARNRRN